MKQKDIFISNERDKWYKRNEKALLNEDFSKDLVVNEINTLINENQNDFHFKNSQARIRMLEVRWGEAGRLAYLKKKARVFFGYFYQIRIA
tara:strand:+ start:183 stop:455 length:273 start_codon:yes stop_codon:yes gene_type:complete